MKDDESTEDVAKPGSRGALIGALCLSLVLAALWAFPHFWYTRSDTRERPVWLTERTNVIGWSFKESPVADSAERLLVADRTFNGEFTAGDGHMVVRAFSAKRYSAKPNDIGLFVHTPDRCWTQGGWKLRPVSPDFVELDVHGVKMGFERRVFLSEGRPELVYFGGLVGGQPLPYRLDHNLSVGMKYAENDTAKNRGAFGAGLRATNKLFWRRIWESFVARRQILGPKQFIRISTPVIGDDLASCDKLLQQFLEVWLAPEDYATELKAWQARKA